MTSDQIRAAPQYQDLTKSVPAVAPPPAAAPSAVGPTSRIDYMMSQVGTLPARRQRALDMVSFFVADVQTGFGPFVCGLSHHEKWTQVEIGFVLTLRTVLSPLSVTSYRRGVLVDTLRASAGGGMCPGCNYRGGAIAGGAAGTTPSIPCANRTVSRAAS